MIDFNCATLLNAMKEDVYECSRFSKDGMFDYCAFRVALVSRFPYRSAA